jgi:hypothetical protein
MTPNTRRHIFTAFVASSLLALAIAACSSSVEAPGEQDQDNVRYGPAVSLGSGTVRTYVELDRDHPDTPVEIGVAMSEGVMADLPDGSAMSSAMTGHDAHTSMAMVMYMNLLDMPADNPTPYRFVQLDWNPEGHEPAGVYDLPHFDFHFYTVSKEVRSSIVPTDEHYADKAANVPPAEQRAPFYVDAATPVGIPPAVAAVPEMGLLWLDVRSPELQVIAGHPESYQPFTKTFIYGSWDGKFIFDEPMITRDYIVSKREATDPAVRDEVIPVPVPEQYESAGYYPGAYRITWDPEAKEYRVALTQLAWRD